jgi:eukaryotic-like serine/threonine-protein kinase
VRGSEAVLIGRVFDDRYEVVRRLGAGGMADVYLANDRLLGRQVALKVLSSRYANDEQFVERFRREASSAASLNHPNIVQIYDRGEAEGTYYIAMEYLEGRSLKEIILKYAPLSPDLLISISVQILEALRFAHRRDVIHRDIKPQNIIVDNDGRVKVTDFGIARAGSASTMTEAGSILGTAHYLSPEQAKGQSVEAASDLYSLGVVMYEMATGKLPFDGDNPVGIAMQHVHDNPIPPRNIAPDIPENLEAVILRALGKEPTTRYLTAHAMLDDLRRAQDGEPVEAPVAYQEEPTRVMTPAAVASAAAQSTQIRRRIPETVDPAPMPLYSEPPRRRRAWPWILVIILILGLAGGAYIIFSNWNTAVATLSPVPGVMGLSEAEAQQKIEDAGFVFKNAGNQPSAEVAEGMVARQDPLEGSQLGQNETVSIWLSSGKGKVKVPAVVGKNEIGAAQEIGAAGLKVDPKDESSDQPAGTVLRQSPEGGQEVDAGATVTIVVARPSNAVAVPRLINQSKDTAVALIQSMGLVADVQEVDSTLPGGTVVDQNPKENQQAQPGDTVTIYVSNAPVLTTVKVPAVAALGLSPNQATARLASFKLRAKLVYQETADFPPDEVIYQSPAAGAVVEQNTVVELTVSQEPPSTTTTTLPPTTTTTAPPTTTTTTAPPTSTTLTTAF